MFKTRPCGCKGLRSCKICEAEYGAWKINGIISQENSFVFCPFCCKLWPGWERDSYKSHPNHIGEPMTLPGVEVFLDFVSPEEEDKLLQGIDEVPWDLSQSGRLKQNYGPKCNFKKKKARVENFKGYPAFTKLIQDRFRTLGLLASFQTVEQCSLDYTPERGSSIDPHIDDCWIWGERIPTLSLLSDSVLTLTPFRGCSSRYNLKDSEAYPRVVRGDGVVKSTAEVVEELQNMSCEAQQKPQLGVTSCETQQNPKLGVTSCEAQQKPQPGVTSCEAQQSPQPRVRTCEVENITSSQIDVTEMRSCEAQQKPQPGVTSCEAQQSPQPEVVRIPMPRRSLLVLYGDARYSWEHAVLRDDVTTRRVCITYRELTPPFLTPSGPHAGLGDEILRRGRMFWEHKQNT